MSCQSVCLSVCLSVSVCRSVSLCVSFCLCLSVSRFLAPSSSYSIKFDIFLMSTILKIPFFVCLFFCSWCSGKERKTPPPPHPPTRQTNRFPQTNNKSNITKLTRKPEERKRKKKKKSRERERENSNSKTLFSKHCSLGSFRPV